MIPWAQLLRPCTRYIVAGTLAAIVAISALLPDGYGHPETAAAGPRSAGNAQEQGFEPAFFLPYLRRDPNPAPTPTPTPGTAGPPAQILGCEGGNAFLNVSPLALSDVTSIIPLGNFNPSGHVFPTDHIYWFLRRTDPVDPLSPPVESTLVSPGGGWFTRMSVMEYLDASPPVFDYTLTLTLCKEVELQFGHVTSLSPKVLDRVGEPYDSCQEYPTGGHRYRYCSKFLRGSELWVEAGEVIGAVGGRSGQNALDLWAWDFRTAALPYANPSRWSPMSLHVVCPLDYFTSDAREPFLGKIGRTVPPVCGQAEQDEPGTAQGAWFVRGTTQTYPEDPHLALAHHNVTPGIGVFSVGTSMAGSGLRSGAYRFTPTNSGHVNRDFGDVTADGSVYCYEAREYSGFLLPWTVVLQMNSPTDLRMERRDSGSCGTGPWSFGPAFTDFER